MLKATIDSILKARQNNVVLDGLADLLLSGSILGYKYMSKFAANFVLASTLLILTISAILENDINFNISNLFIVILVFVTHIGIIVATTFFMLGILYNKHIKNRANKDEFKKLDLDFPLAKRLAPSIVLWPINVLLITAAIAFILDTN